MAIPLTAAGSQCKSSGRTTLKSCINPPADTTFGHHFWPGRLLVRRLLARSRSAHFWPAPLLARLLAQTDRTVLQTISPNLVQCNCTSGFGQFLFLFSFFNFCVLLLVLCVVWCVCSRFSWMRPRFGCSPGAPLPRTPPPQDPPPQNPKIPRTAQNFALFSLSRHNFLSFFPLLGVLSLNFWWSFGRSGPSNVHVWDLGLSSGGFGASRVSNDSPRTPNVHISGPGDSNTTEIQRKDPQEREERKKTVAGEEKRAKFWATHSPFGTPPFGAPLLHELCLPTTEDRGWGGDFGLNRTISMIFFFGLSRIRPHWPKSNWPESNWPKSNRPKSSALPGPPLLSISSGGCPDFGDVMCCFPVICCSVLSGPKVVWAKSGLGQKWSP